MPPHAKRRETPKKDKPVSRTDLVVAKVAALLIAIGMPALVLQNRIWDWASGKPLTWQSAAEPGPEFNGADAAAGVDVRYSGDLIWQRSDAGAQHWLVALLPDVITASICAGIGLLVFQLLQRIHKGRPFLGAGVRNVRTIGILMLSYGVLMPVITTGVDTFLTFSAQTRPSYGGYIGGQYFIMAAAGAVVLVLSEAWRHGQRMDDDLKGLV